MRGSSCEQEWPYGLHDLECGVQGLGSEVWGSGVGPLCPKGGPVQKKGAVLGGLGVLEVPDAR